MFSYLRKYGYIYLSLHTQLAVLHKAGSNDIFKKEKKKERGKGNGWLGPLIHHTDGEEFLNFQRTAWEAAFKTSLRTPKFTRSKLIYFAALVQSSVCHYLFG